ncbi:TPA: restriction endonuclease subunit S, partial [Listeria monocytogenes]|nr:restriction endonuclease subunit S [Listeria monocytogenes]
MKKLEKSMPVIRFKGFSEAWEQRKLEDILDVRSGRDYKHLDSGDIPVYGTGGYMLSVGEALSYEEDAIGIGRKGTIDKPYILKAPFWTVDTLFYTVPKRDSDLNFIHSIFQKINWKSKDESTGVPSLSKTTINAVSVFTPSCSEQKEIGTFFNKLDDTIALHQRKLEALKLMKKAFLQQLFPNNDEKVPRLRFADFDEEWDQRKLGDLGSVVMNRRVFKEETSYKGEIPFYKIGTFGGVADSYITRERFEDYKLKYPYPEKGDVLISASGSIGRAVEYNGEEAYYQDSNIVWLKHDKQLNNLFLKQFYSIVKWSGIEGTTIKRLYNKNILQTEIKVPCVDEQKKIGIFFKQLDNNITRYQSK